MLKGGSWQALSLAFVGPYPSLLAEPQTKQHCKGSYPGLIGLKLPEAPKPGNGGEGSSYTQTPFLTRQQRGAAHPRTPGPLEPGPEPPHCTRAGCAPTPTPFWLLQCRVLMMAPASSIIFRMVPPCTLPATLASSGRMILGRGETRSRMTPLGRTSLVNRNNLGRGQGPLKGPAVLREELFRCRFWVGRNPTRGCRVLFPCERGSLSPRTQTGRCESETLAPLRGPSAPASPRAQQPAEVREHEDTGRGPLQGEQTLGPAPLLGALEERLFWELELPHSAETCGRWTLLTSGPSVLSSS